jgi:hypothetical protein
VSSSYLSGYNTVAAAPETASHRDKLFFLVTRMLEVNKDHPDGTMVAGIIRLGTQSGVSGIARGLLKGAFFISRRGLLAQDESDLAFHIDTGVIIIAIIFSRNPIAGEYDFSLGLT